MWSFILDHIDYHHKKWYVFCSDGRWYRTALYKLADILAKHGVRDLERFTRQMRDRDNQTHARHYGKDCN